MKKYFKNNFHLSGQMPSQTEVVQVAEQTELKFSLGVLLDSNPQERPGDV